MIHMNFVQIAEFDGNIKGKFSKKYSKIFSSEIVMGIKLKLCIHVMTLTST